MPDKRIDLLFARTWEPDFEKWWKKASQSSELIDGKALAAVKQATRSAYMQGRVDELDDNRRTLWGEEKNGTRTD